MLCVGLIEQVMVDIVDKSSSLVRDNSLTYNIIRLSVQHNIIVVDTHNQQI